jgi:hypothetical protein
MTGEDGRAGVWHLTVWLEGTLPDQRLVVRVQHTSDVTRSLKVEEHHEGVEAACASLRCFLEGFAGA